MKLFRVFVIIAVFATAACSTASLGINEPYAITAKKMDSLEKGVTTMDEITGMFGQPEMKVPTADGVAYFYKDINLDGLWIIFNTDGTVRDYEW